MIEGRIKNEIEKKDPMFDGKIKVETDLMRNMLGPKPTSEEKMNWVNKYAQKYGDYIERKENVIIRELLSENTEESLKEAYEIMLRVLKDERILVGV